MNLSIIDLDHNSTIDKNAMNDLLGGCGCCYFPPLFRAPVKKFQGWTGYPESKKPFNPWGNYLTSAGRPRRTNVFLIGG